MIGLSRLRVVASWLAARRPRGEQGAFAALEFAILTPFVLVCVLLVACFGRIERGRDIVDQAAQAAARAGSLSSTAPAAQTAAQTAARQTLQWGGLSCTSLSVSLDTKDFYPGGQVVAHVSCTVSLANVAVPGVPGTHTMNASEASPLEQYRQYGDQP